MEMVIGGAFQGKAAFAEKMYPGISWVKGNEISREQGSSVEALAEELIRKNPEVILVSDEVGYGVVPVDAFQRAYREVVGRTCTKLASFSRKVTRVVCGIGTVIKHD